MRDLAPVARLPLVPRADRKLYVQAVAGAHLESGLLPDMALGRAKTAASAVEAAIEAEPAARPMLAAAVAGVTTYIGARAREARRVRDHLRWLASPAGKRIAPEPGNTEERSRFERHLAETLGDVRRYARALRRFLGRPGRRPPVRDLLDFPGPGDCHPPAEGYYDADDAPTVAPARPLYPTSEAAVAAFRRGLTRDPAQIERERMERVAATASGSNLDRRIS